MPTLIFPYGTPEGILNSKIAGQKKSSQKEQPIRELLQNSFDATELIEGNAKIYFIVEEIKINDMPLYEEYKKEFNAIKEYWEKKDMQDRAREEFKKIAAELEQPTIKVLSVIDNGTGFSRNSIENLFDQNSYKGGQQNAALGSYGQGHLTAYGLSHFRYVTYVGKSKDNGCLKSIYSGSVILAGQGVVEDGDVVQLESRGRILAKAPSKRKCIDKYEYPNDKSLPEFLKQHYNKIGDTGSIVSIIGFNEALDEYIIASNFFMAILNKQIEVDITENGKTIKLDKKKIGEILEKRQSNVRRMNGAILPGREIYKAYQIAQGDKYLKEIELDKQNKVKCYIYDVDDEEPYFMAIFRGGMLVSSNGSGGIKLDNKLETLPNISKREKFSVLITLEQTDCPDFYKLMKSIEDPHHKELNINNASEENKKKIKKYCDRLYEKIIELVPELETEDFPLPILKLFSNKKIMERRKKVREIQTSRSGLGSEGSKRVHEPRPQYPRRPVLGRHDFPGELNYRINKDNNQILIRLKLDKAINDKRLSVALREDTGYDNDISNRSTPLEITGYRLEKNSEIIQEGNEVNDLVYIDHPLESKDEYLLTVSFKTPLNPQPVLEPSIAYVTPRGQN